MFGVRHTLGRLPEIRYLGSVARNVKPREPGATLRVCGVFMEQCLERKMVVLTRTYSMQVAVLVAQQQIDLYNTSLWESMAAHGLRAVAQPAQIAVRVHCA
ncbi:hypothetical protein TRIATDRAFT_158969 [Trichoderma atroviride IMI 206040]|uniref:Uncharacterized protein n=1 Tax=Hypocrea atroviridis (strain ATCC 20476 / IMI 206040) TaxID=452589 RepID=G9P8Q2_HYPAI|nr:uncharacterized protein TRIATDRAFT_158969 [Trichoderma atroviride IMI 206040]EHK40988.1 hypothetical protein TRIATDRAFT_158969 [Trichoderma atroviride IMI 206040]